MNWNSHTKKWIEGNQKFIFQTQLEERVWLSWSLNKVELTKENTYGIKLNVRISNSWWQVHYWELLVLKASWNSSFFCKRWSPFDFVFQDYSPGTALAKMFCVQLFNSWTASNSCLEEFNWNQLSLMEILFDFFWCGMPCFIQSPHW